MNSNYRMHPQAESMIAKYRAGASRRAVAGEYGINLGRLNDILTQHGVVLSDDERSARRSAGASAANRGGPRRREVPADFAALAPKMLKFELINHYRIGEKMLAAWLAETGAETRRPSWRRPIPDDFKDLAPKLTKTQLAKHYASNNEVINRWLEEARVFAAAPIRVASLANLRPVVRVRSMITPYDNQSEATPYDGALFILRKSNPVYRCNDKGCADPKGKFFRIGSSCNVMTGDELLARAERVRERAA